MITALILAASISQSPYYIDVRQCQPAICQQPIQWAPAPQQPIPVPKVGQKGPQGIPGKDGRSIVGPTGKTGPQGPSGLTGKFDPMELTKLRETIIASLPPITVQIIGPDGKILKEEKIYLGGKLKLRLKVRE